MRLRGTKQEAIAGAGSPKQSLRGLAIASCLARTAHNGPSLQDIVPCTVIATARNEAGSNRRSGSPKQSLRGLAIASFLARTAHNGPSLQDSVPCTVIATARNEAGSNR
ncbi:MAG: hypothetical protein LBJ01_00005, partial [Tannerella sp.]|nr:hypothetical protein [Tannerella sp.]